MDAVQIDGLLLSQYVIWSWTEKLARPVKHISVSARWQQEGSAELFITDRLSVAVWRQMAAKGTITKF